MILDGWRVEQRGAWTVLEKQPWQGEVTIAILRVIIAPFLLIGALGLLFIFLAFLHFFINESRQPWNHLALFLSAIIAVIIYSALPVLISLLFINAQKIALFFGSEHLNSIIETPWNWGELTFTPISITVGTFLCISFVWVTLLFYRALFADVQKFDLFIDPGRRIVAVRHYENKVKSIFLRPDCFYTCVKAEDVDHVRLYRVSKEISEKYMLRAMTFMSIVRKNGEEIYIQGPIYEALREETLPSPRALGMLAFVNRTLGHEADDPRHYVFDIEEDGPSFKLLEAEIAVRILIVAAGRIMFRQLGD